MIPGLDERTKTLEPGVTQPNSLHRQIPFNPQGSCWPRAFLYDFLLVFENQLVVEKGVAGRRDESSENRRSSRSGRVTSDMTLTRLAQKVPAPRLGPKTRLSHRSSTTGRLQSSHSGIPNGRNLTTLRPEKCSLRAAAHGTATTAVATCDSGEVNNMAADFRRSLSAAVSSAAPRCPPPIRWAPSVSGPILGNNTKSLRSHTSALLRSYHIPSTTVLRAFSSSAAVMAATKIDGTAIARKVRERLHAEIAEKKSINPRFQPSLKIIQGACVASRHRLKAGP